MAKDDKPADDKDKPKPWTPDQPLEDSDDEEKAHGVARARARTDFLYKQFTEPPKDDKKKKFNPFGE
jgi:hypothetical protein